MIKIGRTKQMKKLFALSAATLAVLGLASCGGQKEQDIEKTKINVWATAAEEEVIKAIVDDYNATHENDFEYEFTPIAEGDCGTTLANDPTVNGAPALFLCADDHIPTLQSRNIVAPKTATSEVDLTTFSLRAPLISGHHLLPALYPDGFQRGILSECFQQSEHGLYDHDPDRTEPGVHAQGGRSDPAGSAGVPGGHPLFPAGHGLCLSGDPDRPVLDLPAGHRRAGDLRLLPVLRR